MILVWMQRAVDAMPIGTVHAEEKKKRNREMVRERLYSALVQEVVISVTGAAKSSQIAPQPPERVLAVGLSFYSSRYRPSINPRDVLMAV